jgi:hypothetical protein
MRRAGRTTYCVRSAPLVARCAEGRGPVDGAAHRSCDLLRAQARRDRPPQPAAQPSQELDELDRSREGARRTAGAGRCRRGSAAPRRPRLGRAARSPSAPGTPVVQRGPDPTALRARLPGGWRRRRGSRERELVQRRLDRRPRSLRRVRYPSGRAQAKSSARAHRCIGRGSARVVAAKVLLVHISSTLARRPRRCLLHAQRSVIRDALRRASRISDCLRAHDPKARDTSPRSAPLRSPAKRTTRCCVPRTTERGALGFRLVS